MDATLTTCCVPAVRGLLLVYLYQCKKCQGLSMDLKHNRCLFKDKQMVRLQENPEDIPQVLPRKQRVAYSTCRHHVARSCGCCRPVYRCPWWSGVGRSRLTLVRAQGETPMTVSLCAFEDLVDVAKPGDRVEVTGIYRAQAMRMKPTQKTLKSVYRTYIDVIHFKRTEKGRLGSGSTDAEVGL